MLKKILLLSVPIAALALLSFQVTNADYYDCQGIIREGRPGPSECRQLRRPPEPEEVPPQLTPSLRLTQLCGNFPCNEPQNTEPYRIDPNPPIERPDEDLDIRKVRKYCVREYCYIIYEICDSSGHCEEEAKRVKQDELDWDNNEDCERCSDWRDRLSYNTYNYFYNNYNNYNYNNYVYRGTHYGRYYNRYWDF